VLPDGIEQQLSPSELTALLAHEVAHLVRRDPWWLVIGEVLCSCLAFQPLNFLARRRWQQAAELLCDDWAVAQRISATSLASCLTRIAEWRLNRQTTTLGLAAVGNSGSLTRRIEWLLRTGRATEPKRPRGRRLATLLTFAAGLVVGLYGPRLSFVPRADASDDPDAAVVWNDIQLDLNNTLNDLARIELLLRDDTDPELTLLASRLRERAASLTHRLDQ
jgi:BlaR1 peptidase M56